MGQIRPGLLGRCTRQQQSQTLAAAAGAGPVSSVGKMDTFPKTHQAEVGIDIDLNVDDIQHPTSTSVIPISEENMSD
jgi:hypothetical protein